MFIPAFLRITSMIKYPIIMIVSDMPKDNQKSTFFFSSIGNRIKNKSDGMTSQKTPCDNAAIFAVSLVSIYIQIKASRETIGIEAKILPANVLLFEISEMATIVTEESSTLMK
jgi:hypothetical protein